MSDVMDWRQMLTRYAQRVESGEIIPPLEFGYRCDRLRARGLSYVLARDLRAAGSADLLRQFESLNAEQIRALNAAGRA